MRHLQDEGVGTSMGGVCQRVGLGLSVAPASLLTFCLRWCEPCRQVTTYPAAPVQPHQPGCAIKASLDYNSGAGCLWMVGHSHSGISRSLFPGWACPYSSHPGSCLTPKPVWERITGASSSTHLEAFSCPRSRYENCSLLKACAMSCCLAPFPEKLGGPGSHVAL